MVKPVEFEKWGHIAFSVHVAKIYKRINGDQPYSCREYLVKMAFDEASSLQAQDPSGASFAPSLFKRLGFLTVQLLSDNVLSTPFRKGYSKAMDMLAGDGKLASSYLILLYAISCMEGSVIASFPRAPRRNIFLSRHSTNDIVGALAETHRGEKSYPIISSLYEQIYYKTHPESQYDFKYKDYPLVREPIIDTEKQDK